MDTALAHYVERQYAQALDAVEKFLEKLEADGPWRYNSDTKAAVYSAIMDLARVEEDIDADQLVDVVSRAATLIEADSDFITTESQFRDIAVDVLGIHTSYQVDTYRPVDTKTFTERILVIAEYFRDLLSHPEFDAYADQENTQEHVDNWMRHIAFLRLLDAQAALQTLHEIDRMFAATDHYHARFRNAVYLELADTYSYTGDMDKAIRYFTQARDVMPLDPKDTVSVFNYYAAYAGMSWPYYWKSNSEALDGIIAKLKEGLKSPVLQDDQKAYLEASIEHAKGSLDTISGKYSEAAGLLAEIIDSQEWTGKEPLAFREALAVWSMHLDLSMLAPELFIAYYDSLASLDYLEAAGELPSMMLESRTRAYLWGYIMGYLDLPEVKEVAEQAVHRYRASGVSSFVETLNALGAMFILGDPAFQSELDRLVEKGVSRDVLEAGLMPWKFPKKS